MEKTRFGTVKGHIVDGGLRKDRIDGMPEGVELNGILSAPILLTKFSEDNLFEFSVIKVGEKFYRFCEVVPYSRRKYKQPFLRIEEEKDEELIRLAETRNLEQQVYFIVVEELEKNGVSLYSVRLDLDQDSKKVRLSIYNMDGPYFNEGLSQTLDRRFRDEVIGLDGILYLDK